VVDRAAVVGIDHVEAVLVDVDGSDSAATPSAPPHPAADTTEQNVMIDTAMGVRHGTIAGE